MRIVHHELEFTLTHQIVIDYLRKSFEVAADDIRIFQYLNGTDIVQVDAAEILAEVQILDLTFGGFVDIQAVLIKELDINHALIERRKAHMHTTNGISRAY